MPELPKQLSCTRCNSTMESGVQLDKEEHVVRQSVWVPGVPEHVSEKVFFVLQADYTQLKAERQLVHPIVAFRCTACGLLEHYALTPGEAAAINLM